MVAILMMPAKLAILGLPKNKGCDFINSVHDITNKILLCDSNYIVDLFT